MFQTMHITSYETMYKKMERVPTRRVQTAFWVML